MREIAEVRAEVEEIEAKRNKIIAEYTEKLENAKKRKAEALEAAEKAYKKAKIEDYHKAQDEERINSDAIKMYESKLAELRNEPVISNAKFKELHGDIAAYLANIVGEDKEDLRELVVEMVKIKEAESEILTEGNALIEHIQKDLLKDPCGLFTKSGGFIEQPNKVKKFRDYSVMEFLNFVTNHPLVSDLVKREELKQWGRGY